MLVKNIFQQRGYKHFSTAWVQIFFSHILVLRRCKGGQDTGTEQAGVFAVNISAFITLLFPTSVWVDMQSGIQGGLKITQIYHILHFYSPVISQKCPPEVLWSSLTFPCALSTPPPPLSWNRARKFLPEIIKYNVNIIFALRFDGFVINSQFKMISTGSGQNIQRLNY